MISNALDHGSGAIEVSAQPAGKRVNLVIADHGRAEVVTVVKQYADGMRGRGLSIAKRAAKRHRGHLRLDDAPTTTFVLDVPLVEASS